MDPLSGEAAAAGRWWCARGLAAVRQRETYDPSQALVTVAPWHDAARDDRTIARGAPALMRHPTYDPACDVCRANAGEAPSPGGVIFANDLWFVAPHATAGAAGPAG